VNATGGFCPTYSGVIPEHWPAQSAHARRAYSGGVTLTIESAPEVKQRVCRDCGRSFSTVHGFLYREGDAYAVYHALLQREHPSTAVDLALSFGSWDEETTASDRTRIGIRIWPDEDELKLHITAVKGILLGRLGDLRTVDGSQRRSRYAKRAGRDAGGRVRASPGRAGSRAPSLAPAQ
jgi:hypothetical protein